jgi:uncharacterized protein YukE
MDVDAVQTVQNKLMSMSQSMKEFADGLNGQIQSMVGSAWVAPGAEQFSDDFQAWMASIQTLLNTLEQNGQRLEQEVVKWQDEAQTY